MTRIYHIRFISILTETVYKPKDSETEQQYKKKTNNAPSWQLMDATRKKGGDRIIKILTWQQTQTPFARWHKTFCQKKLPLLSLQVSAITQVGCQLAKPRDGILPRFLPKTWQFNLGDSIREKLNNTAAAAAEEEATATALFI